MATNPDLTGTTAIPALPFTPGTLHTPLTKAQIATLDAFFAKVYSGASNAATLQSLKDGDSGSEGVASQQFSIDTYNHIATTGQVITATTPPPGAVTTTKEPANWEAAIIAFYDKVTSGDFWLRVAEVLIGAMLLAIGLEKLTNITVPGPVGAVIHSGKG